MAKLYIAEFENILLSGVGRLGQVWQCPALVEQVVAISGTATQSNPFDDRTRLIRVHTDQACSILMGLDPTVTTDNMRLATNQTEGFGVPFGQGYKLSVIAN